jgi:hypothetical protein
VQRFAKEEEAKSKFFIQKVTQAELTREKRIKF